jgi:NADPH:quinone reductase-like Zn-dependent oxidoreductase
MSATTDHAPTTAAPVTTPDPARPGATMRAVVHEAYGLDVLEAKEIPVPTIGPDEVLVQVRAAGLDRGTWHFMTGRPYLMRIMGFGFRAPRNRVAGLDVAGVVAATGANVTRFVPGDEVYGISRGSFAEYAVVLEKKLAIKPATLDFAAAAVVPISGGTALQACDLARIEQGQRVLVIGASGGVGSYAVQLAKALGAEVTGVCSTAKVDLVRALGADHVLDYTRDDFAETAGAFDVILDTGGSAKLRRLRRALAPEGTLVIVGGEGAGKVTGGFGRQLRAAAWSPFLRQRLTMLVSKERHEDADRLRALIEAGAVTPSVDRTYPLAQARDAMRRLEAGEVRGKVAITVS